MEHKDPIIEQKPEVFTGNYDLEKNLNMQENIIPDVENASIDEMPEI